MAPETKKLVSIVIPCLNEEANIPLIYPKLKEIIKSLNKYNFEIIFIDNSSTDNSIKILKKLAEKDKSLKIIINNKNFGPSKSPIHGLLQSNGEAGILICCDMQEPPELIFKLIESWEHGWSAAVLIKNKSDISFIKHFIKKIYYRTLNLISDDDLILDTTGNGIFDRKILNIIKKINDPDPYFRGLICELGFPVKKIYYHEQKRVAGKTNQTFFSIYQQGINGLTGHSIFPLRIIGIIGFFVALLSFIFGLFYLFLKLFNWHAFDIGIAPLIIAPLFLFGILFIFLGIIGEYIGVILKYVKRRPSVVEKERINF